MSVTEIHWNYLDHLDQYEWARLRELEQSLVWLRQRIAIRKDEKDRLVNRGIQRARLAAKRTVPPRAYRKSASVSAQRARG